MLEKDIENMLARYPDEFFPDEGFKLLGQQITVEGRRLDILFEDKHKRKVIIEVKKGILTREASGQIAEYYGLLKNKGYIGNYELILCANIIPRERKTFLETIGIDCRELGVTFITELAKKFDYTFIDDKLGFEGNNREIKILSTSNELELHSESEPSIWIFQANPQRYDIINALSDKEIGNSVHWTVNQHKNKIKKGHLALIWMSGQESGIYALARIESDPMMISEYPQERKYWLENDQLDIVNRVKLTILRRFINNPILKRKLTVIPELASLSILRQFQGTNFPVRENEWNIINQLL
jgi:hypothetical protein